MYVFIFIAYNAKRFAISILFFFLIPSAVFGRTRKSFLKVTSIVDVDIFDQDRESFIG